METDIEKEKQHEIMDVHKGGDGELGFLVHEQDVTMSESCNETKKNTSAEPSNEANTLQKPVNVNKGRKKIKKSVATEKSDNISIIKLNTSRSKYKMTADSESLQTFEIRVPDTTDTSTCSQSKTTKSVSSEDKLAEAVDTETLNLLHTEAKHEYFGTVGVVEVHIEATDMVSETADIVQSKLTEKSIPSDALPVIRAECVTQIPAVIVDDDSPTLLSESHKSQLHTGPKDSKTEEFAYKDVKTQQRSSVGRGKPEEQEPERSLSEKDKVESSSSVIQEAVQPNTSEIRESDIEKEKLHKVNDAETSRQMDACAEDNKSGIKALKQDVTMSEKHTFAEPSNEANVHQKPPNVAKGKKRLN
ncbi:uncharacterized protein LOC130248043 [Danio aesculapii]|uniref:uncharacterized protein LOC130248043 n=1 Tax=Danio aesculapii TaxID=1142201 RepID=UPI0024C0AAB3|nr:uncharacterized protein LOC130248043 [Danio aesculapii]